MREVLKHLMERAQEHLLAADDDRERYAQARPYLEEILEQVGDTEEPGAGEAELFARRWLGRLDSWEEQWASAIEHLERSTELDPSEAAAWADLGDLRTRAGEIPGALEAMREAVALDPDEPMYVFALGNLYLGPMQQPKRALPFLERAAARRPDQAATLLSLGRCLAALGRTDEARARLERARELGGASASLRATVDADLQALTEEPAEGTPSVLVEGGPVTLATEPPVTTPTGEPDDDDADDGEDDEEEDERSLMQAAGQLLNGFLSALGASKDQAIGAVLSAVLGDQVEELHQKHTELAADTPGLEPIERTRFVELIGERVRLAFKEGMENASEAELARGREIDHLLRVEELGIDPKAFADTLGENDQDGLLFGTDDEEEEGGGL